MLNYKMQLSIKSRQKLYLMHGEREQFINWGDELEV